jgi:hypothetical protein
VYKTEDVRCRIHRPEISVYTLSARGVTGHL